MKKLALFFASCILAGTVHAVDVTKAEAATKIKSLPATISTPGYYYLGPNVTQANPASLVPAITITSSNVVLDLNGINIVAFNGILISTGQGTLIASVIVQNGSITPPDIPLGFTAGATTAIKLVLTLCCTIDGVGINPSEAPGPEVNGITEGGNDDVIKNCFISASGLDLIVAGTGNTFVGNTIILFPSSSSDIVSTGDSVFRNNTFDGSGTLAFSNGDMLIGNAFLESKVTGGRDIGGQ